MNTINNNIRALRETHNLTQAQLAEKLGIKGSTDRISMWERGFMYPQLKTFLRMLKIFGVQAAEVYPSAENIN